MLSYSRREFYFAESISLRLKVAGVPTWLDVHRLEVGTDWSAGIEDGLAEAACLLLIASRASLDSAHVEHEWRSALAVGKRIYVAMFEAVTLPAELSGAVVFDFRTRFSYHVRDLADAIKTGATSHVTATIARPTAFLWRLPLGVGVIAMALLTIGLLWLTIGALAFREALGRQPLWRPRGS